MFEKPPSEISLEMQQRTREQIRASQNRARAIRERNRRARLAAAWDAADIGPPLHTWPEFWRRQFLDVHKKNRERFTTWRFLVGNGVAPDEASRWVLATDAIPIHGKWATISRGYDFNANRQVNLQLPVMYRDPEKRRRLFKSNYSAWDWNTR